MSIHRTSKRVQAVPSSKKIQFLLQRKREEVRVVREREREGCGGACGGLIAIENGMSPLVLF